MITYKQMEAALYKWGHYFHNKFRGRFEVHELINEAWIANDLTKLTNIKFASNKIRYNMLSYIREELGGRTVIKKPQFFTNNIGNGEKLRDGDHSIDDFVQDLFNRSIDEYDDLELIDVKDEIDFAMQDCTWRQKAILNKYFLEQKGYPIITKEINRSYGNISKLKKNGLESCKERLCSIN